MFCIITPRNHKSAKLYKFKPPKLRRTSTTNLQIQRTFKEELSKSYSYISKFTGIKLKSLQKPQQITNRRNSTDLSLQNPEELPPQIFKDEEHKKNTKNVKNEGFPTSLQPEIHCNSVPKIFNPFFNQIEVYWVFESKSHYHNSNQQVFQYFLQNKITLPLIHFFKATIVLLFIYFK